MAEGTGSPWNQGVSSGPSWTPWRQWLVQAGFKHWVRTSSPLGFLPSSAVERLQFFQASCVGFCGIPSCSRLQFMLHKCCWPIRVSASSSICPWPGCPLCCGVTSSPLSPCSSMAHSLAPLGGLWSFLNSLHTWKSQGNCYRLNICVPSLQLHTHSFVEILTPKVMLLGGEAFGRWLGYEGGALMNELSALIKETPTWPSMMML